MKLKQITKIALACIMMSLFVQNVNVYAAGTERTIEVVKKELDATQKDYDASQVAYDNKKAEYDQSKAIADEWDVREKDAQKAVDQLVSDIQVKREELLNAVEKADAVKQMIKDNPVKLEELQNALQTEQDPEVMAEMLEEIQKLQEELDYAYNNVDALDEAWAQLYEEVKELEAQEQPSKDYLEYVKGEHAKKEGIAKVAQEELDAAQKTMNDLKAKLDALTAEYNKLNQKVEPKKEEKKSTVPTGINSNLYGYGLTVLLSAATILFVFKKKSMQ